MSATTIIPAPAQNRAVRVGIALMLLSMLLFTLNDALGKWLVSTYSIGQVLLIRSAAAALVLLPFLWRQGFGSLVRVERPGMQALRVLFSTIEGYSFYFAVSYLPLADAMTFWLAAPIYVAALSPVLLGEQVGWRRWIAIFAGFVGVLVALQPSTATLTAPALISVAGSFAFAFMMLAARALRGTSDTVIVFWQVVGAGIAGLVTAPAEWITPGLVDLMLLTLLGLVSMFAHVCAIRALKLADAATVAPFQYTLLLWAVILGWLIFDDLPRPSMLMGAAIIVAAGLFIFYREQRAKRRS